MNEKFFVGKQTNDLIWGYNEREKMKNVLWHFKPIT